MEFSFSFEEMGSVFMQHAKDSLLDKVSPFYELAIENFDAYLVVRAPYNTREEMAYDAEKQKRKMAAGPPSTRYILTAPPAVLWNGVCASSPL